MSDIPMVSPSDSTGRGTVAVVTGAGSGMGHCCVDRLRGMADHLVTVDVRPLELEGTVDVVCDVSDPADVARLAERVSELGSFRALAHAAGISPTMADARRILDVDLVGTERLLRAFEELAQPGSAAVCFSSLAAYQIAPFAQPAHDALLDDPLAPDFLDRMVAVTDDSGFAYSLAKRGVVRACARASVRWGARGGRVNSLAPGLIDTPMGRQELEQQPAMQSMLESVPLARLGEADEVAAVAAFLLSDDASYVSGVDLLVDGAIVPGMAQASPPGAA
jgi:NAD(P)-dependent dehydrogenase (short-subunit alcohol dehydrogenase family)